VSKKILYVDMDNVLVDFQSGIDQYTADVLLEYEDRFDEIPGIFAKMIPLPDAIDAYHELAQLFDTYILSTAPWENPSAWSDKLEWVKKYLGVVAWKRLILSHHKNLNSGAFLIDDRVQNGASDFPGEHLHFGPKRKYPTWVSVLEFLRKNS
jgi:5'-nucleotidase